MAEYLSILRESECRRYLCGLQEEGPAADYKGAALHEMWETSPVFRTGILLGLCT